MRTLRVFCMFIFVFALFLLVSCARPIPGKTDAQLAADVRQTIGETAGLTSVPVLVEVRGGVVYLTGQAKNPDESTMVEQAARRTPGVTRISNRMEILDYVNNGGNNVKR